MVSKLSQVQDQLEQQVRRRTGRRVRNLAVELQSERVVIRGSVSSFHLKQLAQQGVRDLLPYVLLENAITVDSLCGIPV